MNGTSKRRVLIAAAVVGLAIAGTAAVAATTGGDDDRRDTPITGAALERASAAALAHVGEGRVTGTEVGDEDGAYEVEVTREDGSQVDVHLDQAFTVVGSLPDREGGEDESP